MSDYSTKVVKKHSGVLFGSVKTCDCDPLMDCKECHGTGSCQECKGQGEVRCDDCSGNGRCTDCHGKGSWRCDECGGSGNCRRCRGTGDVQCSNCHGRGTVSYTDVEGKHGTKDCPKCGGSGSTPCPECRSGLQSAAKALDVMTFGAGRTYGHGSGKCSKCGGSGEIVCKTCDGSGDCKTCSGSGRLTCRNCDGSGDCPVCDRGKVTCERCDGSGQYQTFIRRNATVYSKEWRWAGSTVYKDVIRASYGTTLYDGSVKTWKRANEVDEDNAASVKQKCETALGDSKGLYSEFLEKYEEQTELQKPNDVSDKPFSKKMKLQKLPVTKIKYRINEVDYEAAIVGDNHLVALKSIPTAIKGFELTKWQKIKLAMTEKSRLKAFAKLAAYIFQCDGKSSEESAVLDSMVAALKLKPTKEDAFRTELRSLNSQMPYEQLRKMITPLLKSKKTLTFVWQCMAVDKKITPEEEKLFDKIVREYDLSQKEVDRLKGLATKFSKLKGEQLALEYADLSDEFAGIRKKVWNTIIVSIVVVLLIAIGVLASIFMPEREYDDTDYSVDEIEAMAEEEVNRIQSEAEALSNSVMDDYDDVNDGYEMDNDAENDDYSDFAEDRAAESATGHEGLYPEASERILTEADLVNMSKSDLKIMRNEIFARHGYIFKTADMRAYFEQQVWYLGEYDDVTSMLSAIEKKNVELIKKFESK